MSEEKSFNNIKRIQDHLNAHCGAVEEYLQMLALSGIDIRKFRMDTKLTHDENAQTMQFSTQLSVRPEA